MVLPDDRLSRAHRQVAFHLSGAARPADLRAAVRHGRRRRAPLDFASGAFNLQPSEFAKIGVALVLAKFFGENRRGSPTTGDLIIGGVLAAVPLVLIAREPDLGTAVTIAAHFSRHRVRRRDAACASSAFSRLVAIVAAPVAWNFALKDYQKGPHRNVSRPLAGSEGRRVSADPGADHRRVGRVAGKGFHQGHAGTAPVPAGRPQRLHFLRAGGGTGFCRSAGRAEPVPARDLALARGGPSRQGPAGRLSRAWACWPASRFR